jgi:hypothetical protein
MAERFIFPAPLTVYEVRKPLNDVAAQVAREFDLFAYVDQRQQPSHSGSAGSKNRQRIGNGKHKDWYIRFQPEPLNAPRTTVAGTLAVKAAYQPEAMQYGGFHYSGLGEPDPTYAHITVLTAPEMGIWNSKAPSDEILAVLYPRLHQTFGSQGTLLDPSEFVTDLFPIPEQPIT